MYTAIYCICLYAYRDLDLVLATTPPDELSWEDVGNTWQHNGKLRHLNSMRQHLAACGNPCALRAKCVNM